MASSPNQPHAQKFAGRAHRSPHTALLTAAITAEKGYQPQSAKGIVTGGIWGETRHRLPESSPGEITQDARNSTSNKPCDGMCTTLLPGKQRLVKASAPRIFTGAGHAGTLCLHTSKSQTRSRKGGVSVNSSGLGSHLAVLGMVGTLPRSRFPEARPRVNLRSRPFNGSQSGLVG